VTVDVADPSIVFPISFHTLELLSLPGLELPYHNFVHDLFSTFRRLLPAVQVENLSIPYIVVAQILYSQRFARTSIDTRLC
jgi:hypothetical protein